jgi:hypothetical protein
MIATMYPERVGSGSAVVEHIAQLHQRWPTIKVQANENARYRIRQIVMAARRLINAVAPAAGRAPLQAHKLS